MPDQTWAVSDMQRGLLPKIQEQMNAIIDDQIAAITGITEFFPGKVIGTFKGFEYLDRDDLTVTESELLEAYDGQRTG